MEIRCCKKLASSEEDYAGCLSALVSILGSHWRHNSQKLLSDRKHWSRRRLGTVASRSSLDLPCYPEMLHEDIDDVDQSGAKRVTLGLTSVKTLIEAEMSIAHSTTDQSNSKNTTGRSAVDFDLAAEFFCENYHHHDKKDDYRINSCSAIEEIDHGRRSHHNEPDNALQSHKHSSLERALGDMAEVFLRLKFIDSKMTTTGQVQSKEFMDALEMLNSNKELFLKLIQDPKSLLLEHSQESVGSLGRHQELVQHEEPVTQESFSKKIRHSLFRKERKLPNGSDSSQASTKIVVLKPSTEKDQNASSTDQSSSSSFQLYSGVEHQQNSVRPTSSFSFGKIKSRLRQIISGGRKDRHATSMDTTLHNGPEYSCDIGEDITTEYPFQPSAIAKKSDKKSKPKEIGQRKARESCFYEEAKRHLAVMLAAIDEMGSLPNKEVSEQLQNIVSSPEYDIVRFSPQLRSFPWQVFHEENSVGSLSPVRQSFGSNTICSGSNVCDEMQVTDSTPVCTGNDTITLEGTGEMVEDTLSAEEQDNLGMTSESNWKETDTKSERCRGEGSCTIPELELDKLELLIAPASDSSILGIKELENLEILENPERPSPESVLEAVFSEDATSPRSRADDYDDFSQPEELYFEEYESSAVVQPLSDSEGALKNCLGTKNILVFVRKLLEASGLSCNKTLERWHLPDRLLDHSLFEEVGTSLSDDLYLIFDCINEVLEETQERLFGCTPWVSLIKPSSTWTILRRGNLTEEVCKGIERHLRHTQFPKASDELEAENWTDLFETEDIGFEMADAILEEMMDRAVYELWV